MQIHCRMPIPDKSLRRATFVRTFNSHSSFPQGREPVERGFRHSAFSFIEVLFAVILLGIGFIMIAGIFPVAIQQTAAVSNETAGTLVLRDAFKKIQAIADAPIGYPPSTPGTTNSLFQPTLLGGTPAVAAFSFNLMQALGTDSFFTADRRFGWVGFYRRDSALSPYAQVFVIALQNPNFPNYTTGFQPGEITSITPAPAIRPPVAPPIPPNTFNYGANIPPYIAPPAAPPAGVSGAISASFSYDTNNKSTTVTLTNAPSAVTGAFVLVANNSTATNMIGRIFRLGSVPAATPAGTQAFYLQPGSDITDADNVPGFNANVFVIGAAPILGANGEYTGPYTGPNQDIAAASAFIRVNLSNN
jgi:hypothetical protein